MRAYLFALAAAFLCTAPLALAAEAPAAAAKGHVALSDKDKELVASQESGYPLAKCVVSGKKLAGAREAVNYIYDGRLVKLYNKDCIARFEQRPEKYLNKIADATAKAERRREARARGSERADDRRWISWGHDPETNPFVE